VDLREEGYGPDVTDPLYVLGGRREGFVPFHDAYPGDLLVGADVLAGPGLDAADCR
ncbi:hypothetical protein H7H37_18980, partial [Mycolicibacterium insubricum]|nr:hypothetical protein [Mycolicibacterium insubricum]